MKVIDFDQGRRLVKKSLFKYYPLRDYHIDAFLNGELFFAKPFALNDCFDTSEKLIGPFERFKEAIGWNERMSSLLGYRDRSGYLRIRRMRFHHRPCI